jgi:hypothetical protein
MTIAHQIIKDKIIVFFAPMTRAMRSKTIAPIKAQTWATRKIPIRNVWSSLALLSSAVKSSFERKADD